MRSSDLDSETESSEDEKGATTSATKQRGAKLPPWMAKSRALEEFGNEASLATTTATTTQPTTLTTDVNQPGEMANPAGEAVPNSDSSDESEVDEEREAKMRAMAAKFNPTQIYGEQENEEDKAKKEDEEEGFAFGFLGGQKKEEKKEEKKKKLYNREGRVPKYLPEESGLEGPGFYKEGPLKGLSKMYQQIQGLRQRPKEANKPQFVEVSAEHVPPKQM